VKDYVDRKDKDKKGKRQKDRIGRARQAGQVEKDKT
jgi:hypothetical protein